MKSILALLSLTAGAALAQTTPVVSQILNNYGLVNPGTVAQGAIFIVKGTSLSDQTTDLQSVPLQTTLRGVTIRITVGTVTTQAPLYYVLPTQLAGILPSNTPAGTGTLVVVNNSRTSTPAPITVVKSAFGMLTISGDGTGAARLQDASQGYQELSSTRATNPGNYLVFYGSGVGATTGNETVLQTGVNASGDLTNVSISVTIGGRNATVLYRGRTAFPGLDQINVQVPTLDAYGCSIAVVITTNSVQANVTTIPVAQTGTTCTPSSGGGGGNTSTNPTQSEIDAWSAAGRYTTGTVGLLHTSNRSVRENASGTTVTSTTTFDSFTGTFTALSGPELARSLSPTANAAFIPTAGHCYVVTSSTSVSGPTITYLDAGPSIQSSGPNGTQTAVKNVIPPQTVYLANSIPALQPGRYTYSGSGGPQVGAFSGTFNLAPELLWNNIDDAKVVTRGNGLALQWSGGDPNELVTITGQSVVSATNFAQFTCWANNSDHQYTVPSNILNQLPASPVTGTTITRGNVAIFSFGQTRLSAPGMDLLIGSGEWSVSTSAQYK